MTDHIDLHIDGKKGAIPLSKETFELKELRSVIDNVSKLFEIGSKTASVSLVAVEDGCAKFTFQSTKQAIKQVAVLFPLITGTPFLKGVDTDVATIIESIQIESEKKGYSYRFVASSGEEITISPNTNFKRPAPDWVDGEFYFYGEIEEAGGSSTVNIHIRTKDFGLLIINTNKGFIAKRTDNLLFHTCGVRAKGRQNILSGEIDKNSLVLLEVIDYTPVYDASYLDSLRDSVGDRWKGVDIDNYLSEIRAYA